MNNLKNEITEDFKKTITERKFKKKVVRKGGKEVKKKLKSDKANVWTSTTGKKTKRVSKGEIRKKGKTSHKVAIRTGFHKKASTKKAKERSMRKRKSLQLDNHIVPIPSVQEILSELAEELLIARFFANDNIDNESIDEGKDDFIAYGEEIATWATKEGIKAKDLSKMNPKKLPKWVNKNVDISNAKTLAASLMKEEINEASEKEYFELRTKNATVGTFNTIGKAYKDAHVTLRGTKLMKSSKEVISDIIDNNKSRVYSSGKEYLDIIRLIK